MLLLLRFEGAVSTRGSELRAKRASIFEVAGGLQLY